MELLLQKRLLKRLLVLFTAFAFGGISSLSCAGVKTIKIPLLDWSSQRVISQAIGKVLVQHHYTVKYFTMSEDTLWGALARGNVHFQLEIWQASAGREFSEMIEKGRMIDLATHSALTTEDWWYPKHVESLCPGLPDWQALKRCASLFAEEGQTAGVYYTGPWHFRDADLIRALKLNFRIKRYQDSDEIWLKLKAAKAANKAIMLLNWTPNWTDQRVQGSFVDFPKYQAACETDPSWGINPNIAFDCGNVRDGWIKTAAWTELEQYDSCVFQFIKAIDLSNEMIAEASALVDFDGNNEVHSADKWLQKYQSSVAQWVASSCLNAP